jgi:hypothetical protein
VSKESRCRVHRDRLWDADAREWQTVLGSWATPAEVDALIAIGAPTVVHGFGRPFRTLSAQEARRFWTGARSSFEVPGKSGASPDDDGLTYAAQVWASKDARLLAFQEFC